MNIVLVGAPGAGKGTQAARMVARYAMPHISTGDIFRKAVADGTPLGLEAKKFMDAGELVPDEVVIGIVAERLSEADATDGFILDGFPRTLAQADALDAALAAAGRELDAVVLVDVPRKELVSRLTSRRQCRDCGRIYNVRVAPPAVEGVCDACGGEVYQRDDDTVETVTNRLDVYESQTEPLVAYYRDKGVLRAVDGTGPIDDVFGEIVEVLG
jgi:adenylate kinase